MARFVLRGDEVELYADVTTGEQIASTPWGNMVARREDVLVPWGNRSVLIPLGLLLQWFALGNGVSEQAPEPEVEEIEEPVEPRWYLALQEEVGHRPTSADLNAYAMRVHNRNLDRRRREASLIREIDLLEQNRAAA